MTFENSENLVLLIVIPIFLGILRWAFIDRTRRLQKYADESMFGGLILNWSPGHVFWQHMAWSLTVALLVFALARPMWGVTEEVVEAEGLAIVIVLDVSSSMDAQDIYPSRLERAKRTAREIFEGAEGNQLGLVLFAGSAFVQLPLTTDSNSAKVFLEAATSNSIGRQGTALADGLELAINIIDNRIVSSSLVIVLSDGENHQGDPIAAANIAASRDISIHVIGYGDPIEGEPLPVMNSDGTFANDYKTDIAGRLVLSRLNEDVLNAIADATNGSYQRASDSGIETVNILNTVHNFKRTLIERRVQTRKIERFSLFAGLAMVVLTVEMSIGTRVTRKNETLV